MTISTETRLKPTSDATVRHVDDHGVIVDMRSGRCWELNRVAIAIWGLIAAGSSVGETIDEIAGRYDISAEAAAADVREFIQSLVEEGLLDVATPGAADGATR